MNLKKVHVITGASKGIGRAVSITLSNSYQGDVFILISRSKEGLLETKSLMSTNNEVFIYPIDLMDEKNIIDTIKDVYVSFKRIDSLINVAGYVDPKSLLDTSSENWLKTYQVNVFSVFLLTREVVKYMKETGGKILNVASTAGITSRPGWSAYASSKAALISFSKTMSEELEGYNIKVYIISPGRCATDLRKKLAPQEDPSTIMQPSEVANVVDNLIGDTGLTLDGQNIIVRKQLK